MGFLTSSKEWAGTSRCNWSCHTDAYSCFYARVCFWFRDAPMEELHHALLDNARIVASAVFWVHLLPRRVSRCWSERGLAATWTDSTESRFAGNNEVWTQTKPVSVWGSFQISLNGQNVVNYQLRNLSENQWNVYIYIYIVYVCMYIYI